MSYSKFNLSYENKLTCNMGELVPICCQEILPGDRFKQTDSVLVRFQPMLAPIMHNVDVFTHYFYVPTRLLWKNFENFITGGEDGQDSSVSPTIRSPLGGFTEGSLADYLGCPTGTVVDSDGTTIHQVPEDGYLEVSALPFRACALIYNEVYRNQNVQDKLALSLDDGLDTTTATELPHRNWMKDFYTSALPFQQRGLAARLPLAGTAPVVFNSSSSVSTSSLAQPFWYDNTGARLNGGDTTALGISSNGGTVKKAITVGANSNVYVSPVADLRNVTAVSISDLRVAKKVQMFMEKQARGGARLVETILSHFGVRVSDSRLQRPLYLGGGRSPVLVSEVLQTSSTDAVSPQGNGAGHALCTQIANSYRGFFEEHGFVIGFMSIMPRTGYQQGLSKMWTRKTRYDYAWPVFSHLSEQAVKTKEIYATGVDETDETVFGFQPIYEEYRRNISQVHGALRSSMNYWTLNRIFTEAPTLTDSFIECTPSRRVFAVTDEDVDSCIVDIWHDIRALRKLPKYGDPMG